MANSEHPRGLLAQLPPALRGVVVALLGCGLVGILWWLDPIDFAAEWRDDRLVLLERILNILVLTGTIWIVLFEGDAILAAFARVFAQRFALTFSFLAEALQRAGLGREAIRRILGDMLARMPRAPPDTPAESGDDPPHDPVSPAPDFAGPDTGSAVQPSNGPATRQPQFARRGKWRGVLVKAAVALAVIAIGFFVSVRVWPTQREPAARQAISVPRQDEAWIVANGSVSATMSRCLGRASWEGLERLVAGENDIACETRSRRLMCTIQDGRPIRLPTGTTCIPPTQIYRSRAEALTASR